MKWKGRYWCSDSLQLALGKEEILPWPVTAEEEKGGERTAWEVQQGIQETEDQTYQQARRGREWTSCWLASGGLVSADRSFTEQEPSVWEGLGGEP